MRKPRADVGVDWVSTGESWGAGAALLVGAVLGRAAAEGNWNPEEVVGRVGNSKGWESKQGKPVVWEQIPRYWSIVEKKKRLG